MTVIKSASAASLVGFFATHAIWNWTDVRRRQRKMMATLVFLHGLNTFGDDDLHLGFMNFGPMSARLESAFREHGVSLVSVLGAGCGTPEEQAERASLFLLSRGISDGPLDLLGHSVGGLVARALAARPEYRGRIRKIITMGTPHRGAHVADFGMSFDARHPILFSVLKSLGYDTRAKTSIIQNFTLSSVEDFNQRNHVPESVEEISLLCEAEWRELSWPYVFGYHHLHPVAVTEGLRARPRSDGFIYSESQKRGRLVGPFAIDHYGQMGFFFQLNPRARRRAQEEFRRLISTVVEISQKD